MKTLVLIMCLFTIAHALKCGEVNKMTRILDEECRAKVLSSRSKSSPINIYRIFEWLCWLKLAGITDDKGMLIEKEAIDHCDIYHLRGSKNCKEMLKSCMETNENLISKSGKHHDLGRFVKCMLNRGYTSVMIDGRDQCKKQGM